MSSLSATKLQRAVRWHPPSFDIRVEYVPMPEICHPDDAIVKISLAGLCGSDLHIYRGHGAATEVHTCGHEFLGIVVALGSGFGSQAAPDRPKCYSELRVGDKVVAPFSVSCGECNSCRLGYTCRCSHGTVFGSPALEGGQAQYVRVPKAGGTLYNLTRPELWTSPRWVGEEKERALAGIADSSLLLLADIVPTGVFGALQVLNHPKVLPVTTGRPWPHSYGEALGTTDRKVLPADQMLTFAVLGLGPVGVCGCIALLDMLSARHLAFRVIAIDPLESRRAKMKAIYATIDDAGKGTGQFVVSSIEESKTLVETWTNGVGCSAVLEIVGNESALTLALDLVRPFGAIVSVGIPPKDGLPFTGTQMYNKNVSLDFGRCPAHALFPLAFDLLVKRQDVLGGVGGEANLIDRVVSIEDAKESYIRFERGEWGKVVFDPWL